MIGNHVYGKLYRGFESLPLRNCFVNVLATSTRPTQGTAHRLPKVEQTDRFGERARRQVHVPERHRERAVPDQLLNLSLAILSASLRLRLRVTDDLLLTALRARWRLVCLFPQIRSPHAIVRPGSGANCIPGDQLAA